MRNILQFAVVLLVAVAGAGTAAAQACGPGGNNFCLNGLYNGVSLDGIYVSPYMAIVNGVETEVICDDFANEVALGESWTASEGVVGTSTEGLFGPENSAGYAQVAWLSEQLLMPANLSNPSQQALITYAIWSVFEPTDVEAWLNANPSGGLTWSAVYAESQLAPTSGNFSNVDIYTPTGGETCCGTAQEFVVVDAPKSAAEASSPAILGIDFLGLGVLLFVFRHQRLAVR
jgi:hypothetical protein